MENLFSENIPDEDTAVMDDNVIEAENNITVENNLEAENNMHNAEEPETVKETKLKTATTAKKSRGPHKKTPVDNAEPKQNFSISLPVEMAKTLNVAVAFGDFNSVSEAVANALYSYKELKPILELVRERNSAKH